MFELYTLIELLLNSKIRVRSICQYILQFVGKQSMKKLDFQPGRWILMNILPKSKENISYDERRVPPRKNIVHKACTEEIQNYFDVIFFSFNISFFLFFKTSQIQICIQLL